jgi:ABC-type transport system involved in multi-copper enzyme maturation permease subunit
MPNSIDAPPLLPPPPLPPRERIVPEPGFRRAWQGLWSLLWRSRLTWRRSPALLATLLVVPALTYFTIEPMQLLGRYDWRQSSRRVVGEFQAEGGDLPASVRTKLAQIIGEEQRRVPLTERATGSGPEFTQQEIEQALEQARACYARIAERARPLLDAQEYAGFERFQKRKLEETERVIRNFNLLRVRPYFSWLLNFYFFLALPLYCLATCGAIIRDEVQTDTLGFLVTRPVGRVRLFLAKYLCQVLWLEGIVALHGLLLLAVGLLRDVPGIGAILPIVLVAQFLAVFSWGALSALLGLVTRRYLVAGIAYGFVVEFGLGRIPTNINTLSLARHFRALFSHDLLLQRLYDWAPQNTAFSVAAVLVATVIFLALGATLFAHREYHPATEMQK